MITEMMQAREVNRDSWSEARQKMVGSSDIATIAGLNKWDSPLGLWMRKTGKSEEIEETPAMLYGREVEGAIQKVFEMMHPEWDVEPNQKTFISEEFPFACCTPDSFLTGSFGSHTDNPGILECKHTASFEGWDDGGATDYANVQLQWQMGCMGFSWGYVAAIVAGRVNDMKDPCFTFEPDVFHPLLGLAQDFIEHVQRDIPPIAGAGDSKIISQLVQHQKDVRKELDDRALENKLIEADRRYKNAKAVFDKREKERKSIINQIRMELDSAQIAVFPEGTEMKVTEVNMPGKYVSAHTQYRTHLKINK